MNFVEVSTLNCGKIVLNLDNATYLVRWGLTGIQVHLLNGESLYIDSADPDAFLQSIVRSATNDAEPRTRQTTEVGTSRFANQADRPLVSRKSADCGIRLTARLASQ